MHGNLLVLENGVWLSFRKYEPVYHPIFPTVKPKVKQVVSRCETTGRHHRSSRTSGNTRTHSPANLRTPAKRGVWQYLFPARDLSVDPRSGITPALKEGAMEFFFEAKEVESCDLFLQASSLQTAG